MNGLDSSAFLLPIPTGPDQPEGPLFAAWRLRLLSPAEFTAMGVTNAEPGDAQLSYLAHFGLLAPTTHNTVPQRFAVRNGRLRVGLDRRYILSASDATGRQAAVSLGAVLENIAEAARCYGLDSETTLLLADDRLTRPEVADEPRHIAVAELSFRPGPLPLPITHLEAMIARKVVRAEFDESQKLSEDLAAELVTLVDTHAGVRLHLLTDSPSLLFLGKFQELADTTVFNRDDFALELGAWLLPNDSDSPLGMRGREFGLSDEASSRIHRGLLRELRLLPDEVAGIAKSSNLGMRSSSAVCIITVDTDTLERRIAAGRAYETVALRLEREGWRTAMHAGITEVDGPNLAMRGRLRTTHRPTVVFRIGRPLQTVDNLRPHASRPSLAELQLLE